MPFSLTRTPLSWPQGAVDAMLLLHNSVSAWYFEALATPYSRKLPLDWCSKSIHSGRVRSPPSPNLQPRVNALRANQPFLPGSHRQEDVGPRGDWPFCVGRHVLPVLVVEYPADGGVASAPLSACRAQASRSEWSHWGMSVYVSTRATSHANAIRWRVIRPPTSLPAT